MYDKTGWLVGEVDNKEKSFQSFNGTSLVILNNPQLQYVDVNLHWSFIPNVFGSYSWARTNIRYLLSTFLYTSNTPAVKTVENVKNTKLKGEFSGPSIAYIYPGMEIAIRGEFKDEKLGMLKKT